MNPLFQSCSSIDSAGARHLHYWTLSYAHVFFQFVVAYSFFDRLSSVSVTPLSSSSSHSKPWYDTPTTSSFHPDSLLQATYLTLHHQTILGREFYCIFSAFEGSICSLKSNIESQLDKACNIKYVLLFGGFCSF